jgi:mevalonate kinase
MAGGSTTGLAKDRSGLNNNSMSTTHEIFYAKILLFGEYSVIFNSMGLAIPYVQFKGKFRFIGEERYTDHTAAIDSNRQLELFAAYLRDITDQERKAGMLDVDHLENDIRKGLYFESSIPQGYGVGSSGALCAAIYQHYAIGAIHPKRIFSREDAILLRTIFSRMESYFHGQSSGLDPLLCYIRQPLLIKEDKQMEIVRIPRDPIGQGGAIFLVDTGISGRTEPLVKLFHEKARSEAYMTFINHQLIPVTNACIISLLGGRIPELFGNLRQLSEMQLSHFQEMIPTGFRDVWNAGLQTEDYYLKLCGSGGGGFLLGMTLDIERTKIRLQEYGITPVLVY